MFKKLSSIVATAALLITGLAATPAMADIPAAASTSLANVDNSAIFPMATYNVAPVPAGQNQVNVALETQMTSALLSTYANKTLSYSIAVSDPSGNTLLNSNTVMTPPSGTSFFPSMSFSFSGKCSAMHIWQPATSAVFPADTSDCAGTAYANISITAGKGNTLATGDYTLTFLLKIDGSTIAVGTAGMTNNTSRMTLHYNTNTFTLPAGVATGNQYANICADTSKLVVGHLVKASMLLDGASQSFAGIQFNSRSGSYSDSGIRTGGGSGAAGITVTDYDVSHGFFARISNTIQSPAAGSHTAEYRLWDDTTSTDVSGSCKPQKPTAPVLTFDGTQVTGSVTFPSDVMPNNNASGTCVFYDAAAPTVKIASVYVMQSGMSSYNCALTTGITVGHSYFAKLIISFYDVDSDPSDATNTVAVTAPGYNVTTSYAGNVLAGKFVKVNSNSIAVDATATRVNTYPDGANGVYEMSSISTGGQNSPPAVTNVNVSRVTSTGADSTIGGTGKISIPVSGFTLYSFLGGFGLYGANRDKFVVSVGGADGNGMSQTGKATLYFGSSSSTTTTAVTIQASAAATACSTAVSGYSINVNTALSISPLSSNYASALALITCTKNVNFAGGTTGAVNLPVLMSIATDGTLTPLTALATPSDAENNFTVTGTSVNFSAATGAPMFTFVVKAGLATAFNQMTYQLTETPVATRLVRVDNAGALIGSAVDAGFDAGATYSLMQENTGTIYGAQNNAGVAKLITIGTTGGATLDTIDLSGAGITGATLQVTSGRISSSETYGYFLATNATNVAPVFIKLADKTATFGEKITFTKALGLGVASAYFIGSDKNLYWAATTTDSSTFQTLFKWVDPRYVAPVGPVPAVTSADTKYALNTPSAGSKITLTGTHLDIVTAATIGGVTATVGTKTATSLQLTIPSQSSAGAKDIVLTYADGTYTASVQLTYVGTGVAQTVTLGSIADTANAGDADITLSATAAITPSDAGTVSAIVWTSSTPSVCTVVAGKAHIVAAGTCTLTATAAANGLLAVGTATKTITVSAGTQTITLSAPANPQADLDGIDLTASASSGLALTFSTTTPDVCTVDAAGHVTAAVAGDCVVTASQAGNGSYAAASQSLTITFAAVTATPIVDNGDVAHPTALPKTGAFVTNGDASIAWNRTKGTLLVKVKVVYIGPITGTLNFKVGSKSYKCSVSFGVLKKQSSAKTLTLTSPSFCSGKTEKTQLALLKKIAANTVVNIKLVRDQRLPTTYGKIRLKTRTIYIKLG